MNKFALPYCVEIAKPLETSINANQTEWFIPTLQAHYLNNDPISIYYSCYLFLCKDLGVCHEADIITNSNRSIMYYDTEQEALETIQKYEQYWGHKRADALINILQITSRPLFDD